MFTVVMYGGGLKLWYKQPAKVLPEALPLGNSSMGVMVYGGVTQDKLMLNEETMWGGGPYRNDNPEALKHLDNVRDLIFQGKVGEAHGLVDQNFFKLPGGMPYQTIGSLLVEVPGHENYTDYRRELDIARAVATTSYCVDGVTYRRELFASLTDKVVVMCLTADRPGMLTFDLRYETPMQKSRTFRRGQSLVLAGQGDDHEGVGGAIKSETRTQVKIEGGKCKVDDSGIRVAGANSAVIYIAAGTNFVSYRDVSGNASRKAERLLVAAMKQPYEKALENHVAKYKEQFDRVSLDLGEGANAGLETTERVRRFNEGNDVGLAALMFQFGRYLLISSSQPGGQPANLQGIWNDQVLAPWDGKYTININTEMNYWSAEVTNLSENHQPLIEMVKELSETGKGTARTLYGADGWVAHHNTDIWRVTGPVDGAFYGMWPHGGGWLSTHLWQHYLYTGDHMYLREVYPALKGAADFYMDFLVHHPRYGWLVSTPSMSPEHGPAGEDTGTATTIAAGCTMDNQIIFEVLNNALAAAEALGEPETYRDSLQNVLAELPPMQIGRHNQLQEWLEDMDNPDDKHRHISHAYGLFPGNQISPYTHPLLFQAVKNTMIQRGDEATGWSVGWKINLWARLQDGNHAMTIIRNMLKLLPNDAEAGNYPEGRTYPNLFDAHPPFQIDGNFGYTAGVAEMLMQSHDGALHVLPALPDAWATGAVKGLVARGGFVTDMKWSHAELSEVRVHSRLGGNLRIRSYVPLKGDGLQEAGGENPNPFYGRAEVRAPLVSPAINPQYPILYKVYEYDVQTRPGESYVFTRGGL